MRMAAVMLCSLALSYFVAFAVLGVEGLLARSRLPRRFAWLAGLLSSVTLTILMLVQIRSESWPMQDSQLAALGHLTPSVSLQAMLARYLPALGLPAIDALLKEAWLLSCVAYVTTHLSLSLRQSLRLRTALGAREQRELDGQLVYVSDGFGPATVWLCNPRIVVPRWLLHAPIVTRMAALAHEREHVRCMDVLFNVVGFVLRSVAPWNLALGWQVRRLNLAVELDCDCRVVSPLSLLERSRYAEALNHLWRRGRTTPIAEALADPYSDVARRIRVLLSKQ
jgi:beta-lactamase regulating signal transducer with metallopeptidase domain